MNKFISFLAKGREAFENGKFSDAIKFYQQGISSNPGIAYLYQFNLERAQKCLNNSEDSEKNIRNEIKKKPKSKEERICLIRVIGNDLPGLHGGDQTLQNLEFLLKYEPKFPRVEKIFILNNIISSNKLEKIKIIFNKYNQKFIEKKFDEEEYIKIENNKNDLPNKDYWEIKKRTEWEYLTAEVVKRKYKNAFLMNNNGARNMALNYGLDHGYDWVFPFDGNIFISKPQFERIFNVIDSLDDNVKYLIFPMDRCLVNSEDIALKDSIDAKEEPQVGFRQGSNLKFDENRVYGNQPKVDVLRKLGVPGVWDSWKNEYPWKELTFTKTDEYVGSWKIASSVFRLASGNKEAAVSAPVRANARSKAIIKFIDTVHSFILDKKENNSNVDYLYYEKCRELVENESSIKGVNDVFEHVYVVNLKKDVEKKLKIQNQLNKLGIQYEIYDAVNGYEGEPFKKFTEYMKKPKGDMRVFSEFSELEKKRPKHLSPKLIESAGAIGYIYTYINIIRDAKKNNYKKILILEDDIVFCKDFNLRFSSFINKINEDWKILHLGVSQFKWDSVDEISSLNEGFYQPRNLDTKGSFSIGLSQDIYDEVLENQIAFEAPFDHIPLGVLYEKYRGKCFVAYPYLVMPDVSESNIRGARNQYDHANRMKWWIGDFSYPQRKLNVGVILTSKNNIKYIKNKNTLDNKNYNICFYHISDNGVLPVHNFEELASDEFKSFELNYLKHINISVDLLFQATEDCFLTEENLLSAIEKSLVNKEIDGGFISLPINSNKISKGRLSVIIPTYKRSSNLKNAIESVLSQSYKNIEVIVVDDNGIGSDFEKSTKETIQECQKKFPGKSLRYIQHKINANGANARNTGIMHSTGEYISFLDDDDIYLPGRVWKSIEALRTSNESCGAVYCGFLGWNSKELDTNRFASGDLTKEILALEYSKHYLHTNTATYKRSAIFRINGFDSSYRRHQDLEFNLRFFKEYKINAIKKCLVRLSPEKSSIDNKIYGNDFFKLKSKFLNQFKSEIDGFDVETKKEIYLKHWSEVIKYAKNDKSFIKNLKADLSNGALQVILMGNINE